MTAHTCVVCGETKLTFLYKGRDRLHFLPGEFPLYRCDRCGLIMIQPPLSQETLSLYYPDDYLNYHHADTAAFTNDAKKGRKGFLRRLRHPIKAMNGLIYSRILDQNRPFSPGPGKKVLDVGCGDGAYLLAERAAGCDCFGLDISQDALRRLQKKDAGIKTFCGSLWEARYPDDFFDAINLCNVLEHVNETKKLLSEVKRILNKAGYVRVQVPNSSSCTFRIFGRYWMALDTPRHVYVFSSSNLQLLCNSMGFDIVGWRTIENSYDVIGSSVYAFNEFFHKQFSLPRLRELWDNEWLKLILGPYSLLVNPLKMGDTIEVILRKV